MLKDSFALINELIDWENSCSCEREFVCANFLLYEQIKARGGRAYAPQCEESFKSGADYLYVPTLDLPDKTIDKLIDYTLSGGVRLLTVCSRTLTETGKIDSRFGKGPVMLLHEFGLLEYSTVISGVYLDKDDLSLMAQEGVTLVVLPSADAGCGYGVAPVRAALDRGVNVKIGSADGFNNSERNIIGEAKLLRLLASAQMNKRDAVTALELAKMCVCESADTEYINETAKIIDNKCGGK